LWNGRKVAEWMSEVTGKKVSRMRGWEYLKQMEYTLKVPRAQHQESSWSEQQEWKKNLVENYLAFKHNTLKLRLNYGAKMNIAWDYNQSYGAFGHL
jgi:hypothetical protein